MDTEPHVEDAPTAVSDLPSLLEQRLEVGKADKASTSAHDVGAGEAKKRQLGSAVPQGSGQVMPHAASVPVERGRPQPPLRTSAGFVCSSDGSPMVRYLHGPKKKWRLRSSRLDFSCDDSSINKSEFRGFLHLFNLLMSAFLVCDPLLRWIETGRFVDPGLAHIMFDDMPLLLLTWLACFLWSFIAYVNFHLFNAQRTSLLTLRLIQALSEVSMIAFATFCCVKKEWGVPPSAFLLLVALIFLMKMHSYTETLLVEVNGRGGAAIAPAVASSETTSRSLKTAETRESLTAPAQTTSTTASATSLKGTDSQPDASPTRTPQQEETSNSEADLSSPVPDPARGTSDASSAERTPLSVVSADVFQEALSLRHYTNFLFCPVLVFDIEFPRGPSFRPWYFGQKIFAMTGAFTALYFLTTRYMIPVFYETVHTWWLFAYIKLLWPMLGAYILVFFILWECLCNLLAEVTSFGDRDFYGDWWNSTTMDEFSRKWNRPVYEFLRLHVYLPAVHSAKMRKSSAAALTFFISALFHELTLAVCFKMVRCWLLMLMMLQIPLIALGQYHRGSELGNYIFWVGLFFGIPVLVIAYGREFAMQHPA